MDIQEQANEYAKGRLAEIIERIIADIYSDGYKAGYQTKSNEVDEVVIQKIAEAKAEVARAEAQREAEERAEAQRIAREKAEAERIAREKAEKEAREKAEAERIAREKIEREREETARKVEAKRLAEEEKKAAKKKAENDKKDKAIKNVDFVDLSLPSETLWASERIGYSSQTFAFREAKKLYHLPTDAQLLELEEECQISGDCNGFEILSADGVRINLNYNDNIYTDNGDFIKATFLFWLDEEEDSDKKVWCACVEYNVKAKRLNVFKRKIFVGEKLPVMVVKSKK